MKREHGHRRVKGGKRSPTYQSWRAMRERCFNPRHMYFFDYGGRGVGVWKLWERFAVFLADMGERPEGMTLDRKNPYGDYTPANCRWATAKTQRANQRGQPPLTD